MVERNLDGYYFRIKRGEEWKSICFTDMTTEERATVMEGRDATWLQSLCEGLAVTLRAIGDQFDIAAIDNDEDEG